MANLSVVATLALVAGLSIGIEAQTSQPATSKPTQVVEGRVEITIVALEKVKEWKMFPGTTIERTITAEGGKDLILVKWEVKDIQTGKPNTDDSFKDFELEDDKGNKYKGALQGSNLREVPVAVPPGTLLQMFRMSGLAFDIRQLAKGLR